SYGHPSPPLLRLSSASLLRFPLSTSATPRNTDSQPDDSRSHELADRSRPPAPALPAPAPSETSVLCRPSASPLDPSDPSAWPPALGLDRCCKTRPAARHRSRPRVPEMPDSPPVPDSPSPQPPVPAAPSAADSVCPSLISAASYVASQQLRTLRRCPRL